MDEHEQFRLVESLSSAIRIAYHGKSEVECPHCSQEMELPVLPLTPVVVCQCEKCKGYVLPFAGQLLELPSNTIESGSDADIRWAIEQVIMRLLHGGVKQLLKYKVPTMDEEVEELEIPDSFDDLEQMWGSNDDAGD